MEPEREPSSSAQSSREPQGLLYILVSAFASLFGWSLSKQNPHDSNNPQDNANNATDSGQNRDIRPVRVIIDSLPPPIPPSSEEKAEKDKEKRRNKLKFYAELIVGFFVIVYTIVSIGLWWEARKSAEATDTALGISQKQLEATDRPWLKITFTAEGRGFYFREDGSAELTLRTHIKNIGHSVANGVIVLNEMFLPSDADGGGFTEPVEHQKIVCDVANKTVGSPEDQRQQNDMLSMVIFPDDTDESHTIGMFISKADIDARKSQVHEGPGFAKVPGGKRIVPYVVGCVDYEFGTSTRHHQTGFIYIVQRRIQVPPNIYPFVMIDITQQVAPSDVALMKYGFGGFAAN